MQVEGQVGPVVVADGTHSTIRQTKSSSTVVQDGGPRYAEPAYRGHMFSASGPPLGGASGGSSAGAMTFAAAGVPLGALWNPPGSGVTAAIVRATFSPMSGTTPPGQPYWYLGQSAAPTAGTKLTPVCNNGGGNTPACAAYGPTTAAATAALTGSSALPVMRAFASDSAFTAAGVYSEETAGDIVLIPGSLLVLAGAVAASAYLWSFGIEWDELAYV